MDLEGVAGLVSRTLFKMRDLAETHNFFFASGDSFLG